MNSDRAKYVVIGNSTAAVGGVEGIRRLDGETPIVLVSREPHHTYSRPLISYLLAGEVDEERMYYRPRDFYHLNGVDARLGVEAVGLDVERRVLKTETGAEIAFETLLMATGGRPFVPEIRGLADTFSNGTKAAPAAGIFPFTSWNDAKAIGRHIQECRPRRAVVVGGGLIGVKAAEALRARGLDVLVVELAERLLPLMLDEQASALAAGALRDSGVEFECGTTVRCVAADSGVVTSVTLANGREVGCEMVIWPSALCPMYGWWRERQS
jgi:nitrite reductase (NADH) large subunit